MTRAGRLFFLMASGLMVMAASAGVCQTPAAASALPQTASTPSPDAGFAGLFALKNVFGKNENGLLVFHGGPAKSLELYRVRGGKLEIAAKASVPSQVWQAAAIALGGKPQIAVAFGYGRGDLSAPVKVMLYDAALANPRTVYETPSPRSQITHLEEIDGQLLIVFFDSKYYTRTAFLKPAAEGPWQYEEVFKTRLGISVDYLPKVGFLVGRPYADKEENTPPLRLFKDGNWTNLPSENGVSSVHFLGSAKSPGSEMLIGDGWQQEYAAKAEPRLSLVSFNSASKKYEIKLLGIARPQINIGKIKETTIGGKSVVFAAGESFIDRWVPAGGAWKTSRIFTKDPQRTNNNLDFAVLGGGGREALLAVWDGELKLQKVGVE